MSLFMTFPKPPENHKSLILRKDAKSSVFQIPHNIPTHDLFLFQSHCKHKNCISPASQNKHTKNLFTSTHGGYKNTDNCFMQICVRKGNGNLQHAALWSYLFYSLCTFVTHWWRRFETDIHVEKWQSAPMSVWRTWRQFGIRLKES